MVFVVTVFYNIESAGNFPGFRIFPVLNGPGLTLVVSLIPRAIWSLFLRSEESPVPNKSSSTEPPSNRWCRVSELERKQPLNNQTVRRQARAPKPVRPTLAMAPALATRAHEAWIQFTGSHKLEATD